jgi:hypothetical protein
MHCKLFLPGYYFRLLCKPFGHVPGYIRHVSFHSLQSVGEAESVPAGYQTDTRHSRAGPWDRWRGSGLTGTVPSYANATQRLHTSPPGDKKVQLLITYVYASFLLIQRYLILNHIHSYRFLQMFEDCWNILLCAIFLVLLAAVCTVAFSAVTVL